MLDPIDPLQIERLRCMTPAQKLERVGELYEAEVRRRMAGLRLAHPDWSDERLEREARRSLLFSGT